MNQGRITLTCHWVLYAGWPLISKWERTITFPQILCTNAFQIILHIFAFLSEKHLIMCNNSNTSRLSTCNARHFPNISTVHISTMYKLRAFQSGTVSQPWPLPARSGHDQSTDPIWFLVTVYKLQVVIFRLNSIVSDIRLYYSFF